MRIAVDAFNLAADRRGMGRIVRTNLQALQRLSAAEIVLVARNSGAATELRDSFSLPVATPPDLRSNDFDAVWYPWNGMRFSPHAPSVVTINDPFAFRFPNRGFVARFREQAPIRRALREADRIFTLSQWGADELERLFGMDQERLVVAPPPVDPFWEPVAPVERPPYFLFVAGPEPRKNAAMLFDAFDAEFGASDGPVLVVAGTLATSDERRFEAMRASRERCRPDDETLRALYSGALAVLVPSLAEGYGMPAVEAMACGAPVLASNSTALPEACGGAAILLSPEDGQAWRQAMRRISENRNLRLAMAYDGPTRVSRIDPLSCATTLLACVRQLREAAR